MEENFQKFLNQLSLSINYEFDDFAMYYSSGKIKKHEILVTNGEVCCNLYFIKSGCLRTYYISEEGHDKTRFIAIENMLITSLSSFISQKKSFEFIDALENTEFLKLSYTNFIELKNKSNNFHRFYTDFLEKAYIQQNKSVEYRLTLSAKKRYEMLFKEKPNFIQRFSNKIIASYIDIKPETLSRLKS